MVKQLQYSSVEQGLSGHPGLQYVAASPAVTAEEKRILLPHMTYRPPPEAPGRPTAADIAKFPVALGFTRHGARCAITQSRYLGKDYSGRYGNFLAHAFLADDAELEGIRPIELWRSPMWPTSVSAVSALPELPEMTPNPRMNPEAIAHHLDARGPDAYVLLGALIDAVRESLARNAGRIIVTAADADRIALWIAAVFYSLPAGSTEELSFLSYTADPDAAQYRLVGTTPPIWSAARPRGQVFHLDSVAETGTAPPSRFADAVVAAWRAGDLEAIDALNEMVEVTGDIDSAAILSAFSQGSALRPGESVEVVRALDRLGDDLPEATWRGLGEALDDAGVEVATAAHRAATRRGRDTVRSDAARVVVGEIARAADLPRLVSLLTDADRAGIAAPGGSVRQSAHACVTRGGADLHGSYRACPARFRADLLAGALDGLAAAAPSARDRVLTGPVCVWLLDIGARLDSELEGVVWNGAARHDRRRRLDVAGRLVRGQRHDVAASIAGLWADEIPTPRECLDLLALLDRETSCRPEIFEMLGRALASGLADIHASAQLAQRVVELSRTARGDEHDRWSWDHEGARADAELVLALWDVREAYQTGTDPLPGIDAVSKLQPRASRLLGQHVTRAVAALLRDYDAAYLAELLTDISPGFRREVADVWVNSANLNVDPHFIAETILRFYRLGRSEGAFEHHLRTLFDSRSARTRCERHLSRLDPRFVEEFNERLRGHRAPSASRPGLLRRKFNRER